LIREGFEKEMIVANLKLLSFYFDWCIEENREIAFACWWACVMTVTKLCTIEEYTDEIVVDWGWHTAATFLTPCCLHVLISKWLTLCPPESISLVNNGTSWQIPWKLETAVSLQRRRGILSAYPLSNS
jgi:hypothetical protein